MVWSRMLGVMALTALAGCATVPLGPTVRVLPPPTKPFEVFQVDDQACRGWAAQQVGVEPAAAANETLATGAVAGTAIGAGLGALLGSVSGSAGAGAAIGGGFGLLAGLAGASEPAYATGGALQRRYDIAYEQCMYARGNLVGGMPQPQVVMPPPPSAPAPPAQ